MSTTTPTKRLLDANVQTRITSNINLARCVLNQFLCGTPDSGKIDRDEVEAIAFFALKRAALEFDPACGVSFASYAQKKINHALRNSVTRERSSVAYSFDDEALRAFQENSSRSFEIAETEEMLNRLRKAVQSLPPQSQRIVEICRQNDDLSLAEAGQELGLSRARSAVMAKEARQLLKARLSGS